MTGRFHRLLMTPALAGLLVGAAMVGTPGNVSADTEGTSLAVGCRDGVCESSDPDAEFSNGRTRSLHRSSGNSGEWQSEQDTPMRRMPPGAAPMRRMPPPDALTPRLAPAAAPAQRMAPRPDAAPRLAPAAAPAQRMAPRPDAAPRLAPAAAPARRLAPLNAPKPSGRNYQPGGYKKIDTSAVCSADYAGDNVALLCDNDVKNDIWIKISQWGHGNQANVVVMLQVLSQFAASGNGDPTNVAVDNEVNGNPTQSNKTY